MNARYNLNTGFEQIHSELTAAARLSGDAEVVDSLCELQRAPIEESWESLSQTESAVMKFISSSCRVN